MVQPISHSVNFYNTPDDRIAGAMPVVSTSVPKQESVSLAEPKESNGNAFIDFIKGVIDVVNPLQHIPIVGNIYRDITGDEIGRAAKIAGDVLYGGAVGGAISIASAAYEKSAGERVEETIIGKLNEIGTENKQVQVAKSPVEEVIVTELSDVENEQIQVALDNALKAENIIWSENEQTPRPSSAVLKSDHIMWSENGQTPRPSSAVLKAENIIWREDGQIPRPSSAVLKADHIIWHNERERASTMALQMSNAVKKYNELIINKPDTSETSILT